MADVRITRIHDDALRRLLSDQSGGVARDLTRRGLRGLAASKDGCPVDTGRLRASHRLIVAADARGVVVRWGTDVEYARAVHDGQPPHIIEPRNARVLAFTVGGQRVFAARVHHPGARGRPWLRDSLRAAR